MGWDVNVHVNLRLDVNIHVNLRQQLMMMMMMMMTTLMQRVDSATKFRHGMDKFYQPNSGLRSSRSLDEAIYTHTLYMYIYIYIHTYRFIHSVCIWFFLTCYYLKIIKSSFFFVLYIYMGMGQN